MLHEILKLIRPIIFFDCETTGQNPREDRIVEFGFIKLNPNGTTKEWQSLINPGIPIPHEATYGNLDKGYEGHGITDEMVRACSVCKMEQDNPQHLQGCPDDAGAHDFRPWPTFKAIAENLYKGFQDCDYGGYNVKTYDLPLMQAEFERYALPWSYAEAKIIDGYRLWQIGRKRSLSDAVEKFLKRPHKGAHRALDDVQESLEVIVAQLQMFTQLPRDLTKLHELQWPIDPNAIDPAGKIIWQGDAAVMNFGKNWKGKRLDLMPRKELEWIVDPKRTFISPEVRKICNDALQGKFPRKETL